MRAHTLTTAVLTLAAGASLCACRSDGNDRSTLGGAGGVTLSDIHGVGDRSETHRDNDAASIQGLSRAGWARQTIDVPVEGVNGFRRYARNYQITQTTSRQRGDYPSPLSSLELTGGTRDEQFLEAFASGPEAMYEGITMIPRFFFVRPCEEVRTTPAPHWRAPVSTPRFTPEQRAPEAAGATSGVDDPAAAPK